ncbi:DUF4251 domain-containing protein [Autumnicola musiva]|uniref:DUF4251 domain-containing protein n=1 Tax=Autumnicola musiva TaxID=3075589 RepID=A0ABU3D651_9FLAO|nr:DUF4251 domain-containing protein [Zunongwangia sp. F117]MDT0677012.1 DUF4251 domain-containing protein [Zunongwangia sp. F117]
MRYLSRMKSLNVVLMLGFAFILCLFSACGGSKRAALSGEYRELVNSRKFEIENDWAVPLRGSMINLIGNPNSIRFKGDSVDVFLPYFGVRHSGGGYGDAGGIEFKGSPRNVSIEESNKDGLQLKFEGNDGNENLQFIVNIFSNGNTTISVNSSQRDAIRYRGNIGPLKEQNE